MDKHERVARAINIEMLQQASSALGASYFNWWKPNAETLANVAIEAYEKEEQPDLVEEVAQAIHNCYSDNELSCGCVGEIHTIEAKAAIAKIRENAEKRLKDYYTSRGFGEREADEDKLTLKPAFVKREIHPIISAILGEEL